MTLGLTPLSRITPSPHALFQPLDDAGVLLHLQSERYYGLNAVGARSWQLLTEHQAVEPVVAILLQEYAVDEVTLRRDLSALVADLIAAGLVDVSAATPEGQ